MNKRFESTPREVPGANIKALRTARKMSLRDLGDACDPPMDYTSVHRIENNSGYTRDGLERLAKALRVTVQDFFLPDDIAKLSLLSPGRRAIAKQLIDDMISSERTSGGFVMDQAADGAGKPYKVR